MKTSRTVGTSGAARYLPPNKAVLIKKIEPSFPRKSGRCNFYEIDLPGGEIDEMTEKIINRANEFIKENPIGNKLIYGDIVHITNFGDYRNDGKLIFDGQKLIALADEPDDYGNLPQKFHVIEHNVPIDYWADSNDHNYIVWFDHTKRFIREQCLKNIKYEQIDGAYVMYTEIRYIDKKIYYIIFDYIEDIEYDDNTYEIINSEDTEYCLEQFKNRLSSDESIIFSLPRGIDNAEDGTKFNHRNTLYMFMNEEGFY